MCGTLNIPFDYRQAIPTLQLRLTLFGDPHRFTVISTNDNFALTLRSHSGKNIDHSVQSIDPSAAPDKPRISDTPDATPGPQYRGSIDP